MTTSTTSEARAKTTREDVYSRVTNQIVGMLERGVRPWQQPWRGGYAAGPVSRPLRHNGQRYSGINVLMLWMEAEVRGFQSPQWMTYKQAQELKAQVRKGEKGTPVVYASSFKKEEQNDAGEAVEREIHFLKEYTVFNVEQIDNLPASFYAPSGAEPATEKPSRLPEIEASFAATRAEIRHGGGSAFYLPSEDRIQMPPLESFKDVESYYGTLAHELTHWTRHASRLNRDFSQKVKGDDGYAQEELVAELGASFLAADLGFENEVREDHASYLAAWLRALRNDKKFIFFAASHASKAVDYLHTFHAKGESRFHGNDFLGRRQ